MLCPTCNNVQLVMSEREGIEIDYCPQCRGVWLDRGELDKIIERSAAEEMPAPRSAPGPVVADADADADAGRDHGSGHLGKPYRRKSIWSEIFD